MRMRRSALPVPNSPDKTGGVSWVHFGDLHMTTREQENGRDFHSLVDDVNRVIAGSPSFAYLPGDNADHGGAEEYELVRDGLDQLRLPWFAIVGDHDVHPRSHANSLQYMMPMAFYSFESGACRFFALASFASDDPKVFGLSKEQLEWLRRELALARTAGKYCALLLPLLPERITRDCRSPPRSDS